MKVDWIFERMAREGDDVMLVSRYSGVKDTRLREFRDGKAEPSAGELAQLAYFFHLTLEQVYLLCGIDKQGKPVSPPQESTVVGVHYYQETQRAGPPAASICCDASGAFSVTTYRAYTPHYHPGCVVNTSFPPFATYDEAEAYARAWLTGLPEPKR